MFYRRGDIFYANLSPVVGSEQDGIRPVLIVQNDIGNKYSPTVIILPITSKIKNKLPTHVDIDGERFGLDKDSVVLAEQVRTIDKIRLLNKIGRLDNENMEEIKKAIKINFSIRAKFNEIFNDW